MEEIKYFEVELCEIVEKLRRYFEDKKDIVLVILFGSILRRNFVRDVDIAVYFSRKWNLDELLKIGYELEDFLKIPVDIIPLDQALPQIKFKVLREELPIVIRDRALYTELLKITMAEIEDMEILMKKVH